MTAHLRIAHDTERTLLARLLGYQERIEAILARGEHILDAGATLDGGAIGQLRWELARTLGEYQIFKHTRLFDPLIVRGGPRSAAAAAMKQSCITLGGAFRAYVIRWTAADILDRPDPYRTAALVEVGRLRTHLKREREGARQLLQP